MLLPYTLEDTRTIDSSIPCAELIPFEQYDDYCFVPVSTPVTISWTSDECPYQQEDCDEELLLCQLSL